jgi:hypothetical protein
MGAQWKNSPVVIPGCGGHGYQTATFSLPVVLAGLRGVSAIKERQGLIKSPAFHANNAALFAYRSSSTPGVDNDNSPSFFLIEP